MGSKKRYHYWRFNVYGIKVVATAESVGGFGLLAMVVLHL